MTALPPALHSAALAWLKPEAELTADLTAAAKDAGSLAGLPYLLKDLFDLAGVPTRAGSRFLEKIRPLPTEDSRIVKLLREKGSVCAGKTHLVEFASGLTGENPHYGDCPHPQFPDRLSGGSSSGSAALVAAGVAPLAIGTDTGGSVRVPAAFCGLHGFRLTPGGSLISDAFPLAPTMDTAGWFTASGPDMLTSWDALVGGEASRSQFRGCYVPMNALLENPDLEVAQACDSAAGKFCSPIDSSMQRELLEAWQDAVDAYVTIGMSEAHNVHRAWLVPHRDAYDPVIWQRFTDAGHYPPEKILLAREHLERIRATWRHFFSSYDYLVLPAVPGPAPRKADCTPELRRNIIRLNSPASLGGLSVLSLPVVLSSGLTVGLQVILPVANSPVVPWLLRQ